MALLAASHLHKSYGPRAVVRDVSLQVDSGEIVGLLGPNGAGKTTTFYMIVGLLRPAAGTVRFRDRDVSRLPMHKRARLGMGYLAQEPSVFRRLTVEENLLAIAETLPLGRADQRRRVDQLLEELGISHVRRSVALTLSGGERRRLEIARALVIEPRLLLLDEPFSGVDPIAVNEVKEIIRGLRAKGLGMLITDHNVRDTLDVCDRALLLCEGRVEREGTSEFLANDPVSRELYLGPRFSM